MNQPSPSLSAPKARGLLHIAGRAASKELARFRRTLGLGTLIALAAPASTALAQEAAQSGEFSVQRLESGTYNPRLRVVEQLCVAMKIEPGALLTTAEAAPKRGRGRPKKNTPTEPTRRRKRRKPAGDAL